MHTIDISGLDKADVLAALFNGTAILPVEIALGGRHDFLNREQAQEILDVWDGSYFDYLHCRVMKIDIGGD